jgi:hypothetical protein
MRIQVSFQNPQTGETRRVKLGWSWTLFFFAGLLGLPLFLRGLTTWGAVFAGFWAVNIGVSLLSGQSEEAAALAFMLGLVGTGLGVFIAMKGNELTAKHLLSQGWRVVEPGSEFVRMALSRWGIANPPVAAAATAPPAAQPA